MRDSSYRAVTTIASLRDAVDTWRRRERWSMATVVDEIVKTHEARGLDVVTDIHFEPNGDEARRMATNGERVYRWLDDVTKPNNHLPANFVRSILAALPMDLRIGAADALLDGTGLSCRLVQTSDGALSAAALVAEVARESGEATAAVAALVVDGSHDRLRAAQRELKEAIAAQASALASVEAALGKAELGRG